MFHSLSYKNENGWGNGNSVKLSTRDVHMEPLTNDMQHIPPKKRVY